MAGTSPPRHRPGVVLRDTTASCATPHGVLHFAYIESESSKKHCGDTSSQNDASSLWPIGAACRHAAGCVLKRRPLLCPRMEHAAATLSSPQSRAPSFGDEPHVYLGLRDAFSETNLEDSPKFKQPGSS